MCDRKAVALFSTSGVQQRWAVRISSLLDIPEPAKDDQFSLHICDKCMTKISFLEKATAKSFQGLKL